jgi:hypothetical protein
MCNFQRHVMMQRWPLHYVSFNLRSRENLCKATVNLCKKRAKSLAICNAHGQVRNSCCLRQPALLRAAVLNHSARCSTQLSQHATASRCVPRATSCARPVRRVLMIMPSTRETAGMHILHLELAFRACDVEL